MEQKRNVFALFDRYRELMDAEYDTPEAVVAFTTECQEIAQRLREKEFGIFLSPTKTTVLTRIDERGKYVGEERTFTLYLLRLVGNQTPVAVAEATNRILVLLKEESAVWNETDTAFLKTIKMKQ